MTGTRPGNSGCTALRSKGMAAASIVGFEAAGFSIQHLACVVFCHLLSAYGVVMVERAVERDGD